ncbi:uncharacterized protein LOC124123731 isoform X1 [Haliotis rufescens]|uniref:uncharacterized protein LOC124123731 isoform X1 n=2 Tax=Haliotis rufescens TaxID=6454 RepID=UPI001EAFC604|nr:uncharacterized protein LOC124123731 isoform X1 [Haliotis rufescens]
MVLGATWNNLATAEWTTMKIACCLVVFGLAVVSADLLSLLKRVHNSNTFVHMPHYEQLLLVELMAEAEMGQLTQYIHTVGMSRISTMMQHIPQHEADLLTQYLKEHMTGEAHPGSTPSQ